MRRTHWRGGGACPRPRPEADKALPLDLCGGHLRGSAVQWRLPSSSVRGRRAAFREGGGAAAAPSAEELDAEGPEAGPLGPRRGGASGPRAAAGEAAVSRGAAVRRAVPGVGGVRGAHSASPAVGRHCPLAKRAAPQEPDFVSFSYVE